MKRVLMLAHVASMISLFNLPNIRLLQEMGYDVDVACNFDKGSVCTPAEIQELKKTLEKMNVKYYQIDFDRNILRINRNIKALRQVKSLLETRRYEFLHCHTPIGGFVGRVAGKLTSTQVIYTAHGFHFYKGAPLKNWLVFYPIEKICSYMTDVLITINKEDYELAKRKMKAKKIEYVPGVGIDLSKFSVPSIEGIVKRSELDIAKEKVWVLTVGELIPRKNHEPLIRAVAKIPNVYLTIAGKGELQEELERVIEELGVGERVKLLGFRRDISELCASCDIFAFPSLQEGLPVALMEAMASAKPVICSSIRGNTDLIVEGKGGRFFKAENIDEIISAIQKILCGNWDEMGAFNRKRIELFELSAVMEQNRKIYLQCGERSRERNILR